MRNGKSKWNATIWLLLGITGLQAQNTLFVNEKSGTKTPFAFTSVNTLTFASGNMTVNKRNGSTNVYALTNIRYLNLGNTPTVVPLIGEERRNDILLYPNPVSDQLHIQFKSETTGNAQFQILNVQGKVICQQTLKSFCGTNDIMIRVADLEYGLYICRLINATKIETTKFTKY